MTRSHSDRLRDHSVDLETSTAEVSSNDRNCEQIAPSAEAVRKDPAVHVSLSSDSPVKQPGIKPTPSPDRLESRRSPTPPTEIGGWSPNISEELRRRAIAPRRRRTVCAYIGRGRSPCQHPVGENTPRISMLPARLGDGRFGPLVQEGHAHARIYFSTHQFPRAVLICQAPH